MNFTGCGTLKQLFLLVLIMKLSDLRAQVPVHEEPFHRPVFENRDVRILNVVIPPGDTSLYHIHSTPSVFIFLSNTAAGTQLQGKGPVQHQFTAGRILFEDLGGPNTRIHCAWNSDKENLHVIDVELLYKKAGFKTPPMTSFKLEIDTAWVRAYKVSVPANENIVLGGRKNSFILVSLNAGSVDVNRSGSAETQALKTGSFLELKRKKSFSLKNTSGNAMHFALLELPGR